MSNQGTDRRWHTAVHEAGHAVAARALGRAVRSVTIVEDGEALGRVRHYPLPTFSPDQDIRPDRHTRWRIEQSIMIAMAGVEAEHRVNEDANEVEAGGQVDFEGAAILASFVTGGEPEEAGAYVTWLSFRVRNLLANELWWVGVEHLAHELLEHPFMNGKQAIAAIQTGKDALIRPRPGSPFYGLLR